MWFSARFVRVSGVVLGVGLLATGCALQDVGSEGPRRGRGAGERASTVASGTTTNVVAVGDIACPEGQPPSGTTCRQDATAALARQLGPDLVLTLGDEQYQRGSLNDFQGSYDKSWGSLLGLTRPVPGNHEYFTAGASGYYSYFKDRQPGPPGYYRVVANGWNLYLLNSNCDRVSCRREASWLARQMDAHPSRCSLIAMHHPRYSSGGEHGNSTTVTRLWKVAYGHRTDVALAGHDHDYERFKRMDPWNAVRGRRGIQSFVSGAGGRSLYPLGTRKKGSVYFQNRTPGVLQLQLGQGSYTWKFHAIDGSVLDSGSNSCI